MRVWTWTIALVAAAGLSACATTAPPAKAGKTEASSKPKALAPGLDPLVHADAFPSTYRPMPSRPTALVGASVFTGTGTLIENGVVLVKDGRIEQSNFDTYNSMRIAEMPKVESIIMPSMPNGGGTWGGVGEPTICVAAPAVLNAYFAATGKRIRSVPLRDQNITFA